MSDSSNALAVYSLVLVACFCGVSQLQGCGGGGSTPTPAPTPAPPPPLFASKPSWADEFDSCPDDKVDPEKWGYERGYNVRKKKTKDQMENETYVSPFDHPENANCTNGELLITALKAADGNITSVSLSTLATHKFGPYGKLEMKARFDTRKGSWPAFWTLGADWNCDNDPWSHPGGNCSGEKWPEVGELDIMEYNGKDGTLGTNIYWQGLDWQNGGSVTKPIDRETYGQEDHIYTAEITPTSVTLKVDGKSHNCQDLAFMGGEAAFKDKQVQVIVNLAVGGTNGGYVFEEFPYWYAVDYVRYYEYTGPAKPPSCPQTEMIS